MNLTSVEILQQAVAAHRVGNLPKAERLYKTIIGSHPGCVVSDIEKNTIAMAYNNLGFALQHKGELDAAIKNYKQAVTVKPDYHEARINLGVTLALKGDLKGAINSYKKAVEIKPDLIEAYYCMGHALQEKGDLKASVESYQKILKLRPNSVDAFNALGAVQQIKGDLDAAVQSFKQVIDRDPGYYEAYNNLGCVYQAKGNLDGAIECFEKALEIKPDYVSAYNNMGHALFDKGEFQSANDSYKKAIEIMPDSAEAYNNLANALKEVGDFEEALKNFEILEEPRFSKVFAVSPSKPLFWMNAKSQVLECLYTLGRYSELEEKLIRLGESGDVNRRVAAVGAFVSHQLKIENPLPFCKNPLDFAHVGNLSNHIFDLDEFVGELMQECDQESQVWEPIHGVTKSGYATSNTIFQAGKHCQALEEILRKEIAAYYFNFRSQDCEFVKQWPDEYDLKGWFVRLVKNGHQRSHIHPAGWLSGVVYLKTLEAGDTDEGAIELSLHGLELPVLDDSYARKVHRPRQGEILLFPSSLFHRTIPFEQATDRCVIAFDLHRVSTG